MGKLILDQIKQRFSGVYDLCPNMSDEVYALAHYFAAVSNDSMAPEGVMTVLLCMQDDLRKKRRGFGNKVEFPAYLAQHSELALAQLPYLLQVLDAVAEQADRAEFAEETRRLCYQLFGWNVPKRVVLTSERHCHPSIKAAADWWVEAIQHPKMDNGTSEMSMFVAMLGGITGRQFTVDELNTFRDTLIDGITYQMTDGNTPSRVVLCVDYSPEGVLWDAAAAIGASRFSFPCKTCMVVTDKEVQVAAGCGAPYETIWRAEPSA